MDKYKEALERAKKGLPIDEVFPELKESEDERIRKTLIHIVKGACDKYGIKYRGDEIGQEKLLAYLEKQKEQKPAEWSEEDDVIHTRVLGALGKAFMGVIPTKPSQEDIEWFKSLPKRFNLQPKQEWSEEDEKKISFLCGLLEHNLHEGTFAFGDGAKNGFILKQEAIEMLKSLRPQPHWKPSEEQMDALLASYKDEGVYDYYALESLYNDLQKLL